MSHLSQCCLGWDFCHWCCFRVRSIFGASSGFHAAPSSSSGSGIEDGGSLVGNESANVLSRDFSRISSGFFAGLSSGSLPLPRCSGSLWVICGVPFFSSIHTLLNLASARMRRSARGLEAPGGNPSSEYVWVPFCASRSPRFSAVLQWPDFRFFGCSLPTIMFRGFLSMGDKSLS